MPTRTTPVRCNGERVPRFNERGAFKGAAWYGYKPGCACVGCRREHERRGMRVIRGHGGLREAAHIVLTVPEHLRPCVTAGRLSHLGSMAERCVRRTLADALGVNPNALGGLRRFHPAGDDEKTYHPHVHLFLVGPGLEALAAGKAKAAVRAAVRVAWQTALASFFRVPTGAVTTPFVRWYEAETPEPGNVTKLDRALRHDACRSFPGWDDGTRLVFFGTLSDPNPREREATEPVFDAGAIPLETLHEAHGEARTRMLLSRSVLDFYEARAAERAARESARLAPVVPEATSFHAAAAASSGPAKWTLTVNVAGVTPWVPLGRVGIRVAAADARLAHALANLARRFRRESAFQADEAARGLPHLALALRSARHDLESIARDVERRTRPSVSDAAEWVKRALRAVVDGTGPLPDAPPLQVSGLLTLGELRFAHEQITTAADAGTASVTTRHDARATVS